MRRLLCAVLSATLLYGCGGGGGGGDGQATVYFVRASNGDDARSGLSPDDALATIPAALSKAGPGDTVVVGPGTYRPEGGSDAVVEISGRTGSASQPITVRGDDGTSTDDNPGEVIIDANGRGFGFRLTGSSHVILDTFVILGARGSEGAGIQVRADSRNITIRNCEVTESVDGIRIEGSSDILLFNNLVHTNGGRGIQVSTSASATRRTSVIQNTVALNGNDGISATGDGVQDLILRNNIVFDNDARGIDIDEAATRGYDGNYDLVYPTNRGGGAVDYGPFTPKGLNDVNLDPLFVERFRLSQTAAGDPADSPALNAGDASIASTLREEILRRTTASNDLLDSGLPDIGFHFPSSLQPAPTPTGQIPPTTGPTAGPATRIYVRATTGNDGNDGKSPTTALATIQKAVDASKVGTEIIVGPGRYPEEIHVTRGGQAGKPILLRADPTGASTGDSPGPVLVDGQTSHRGFFVDGAPFFVIDGFTIADAADAAIQIRRAADTATVRNCEIYGSREDAIRVQDSPNVVILNNLIYCNARRGILIAGAAGSSAAKVVNNTVVANRDRGIFVGASTAASPDAYVRNNITQDNCNKNLQVTDNSASTFDGQYNLVSPPTYSGVSAHPTDTAYGPEGGAINVPAGFLSRARCDGLCPPPVDAPPDPTPRPTPAPLPSPIDYNITRFGDEFRLSQTIAGDPPPDGTGVDRGDPALPKEFADVVRPRSTASNGEPDGGRVDMGYHFAP